jgi:hypothetical protein
MMRNARLTIFLISCGTFFFACDRFYVIRGIVVASPPTQDGRQAHGSETDSSLRGLHGVLVTLYHIGGRGTLTQLDTIIESKSDLAGEYRLFFPESPLRGLSRDFFLEFTKPGYNSKRIHFTEGSTDPTVEIGPCTRKEASSCWVVNVMMIPATNP